MEALNSSETLIRVYQSARRHIPENGHFRQHSCA